MKLIFHNHGFSSNVDSGFEKECSSCSACQWEELLDGIERWILPGGAHTQSECLESCKDNRACNFASITTLGFCYMVSKCDEKFESSTVTATRYKKMYKGKIEI